MYIESPSNIAIPINLNNTIPINIKLKINFKIKQIASKLKIDDRVRKIYNQKS